MIKPTSRRVFPQNTGCCRYSSCLAASPISPPKWPSPCCRAGTASSSSRSRSRSAGSDRTGQAHHLDVPTGHVAAPFLKNPVDLLRLIEIRPDPRQALSYGFTLNRDKPRCSASPSGPRSSTSRGRGSTSGKQVVTVSNGVEAADVASCESRPSRRSLGQTKRLITTARQSLNEVVIGRRLLREPVHGHLAEDPMEPRIEEQGTADWRIEPQIDEQGTAEM